MKHLGFGLYERDEEHLGFGLIAKTQTMKFKRSEYQGEAPKDLAPSTPNPDWVTIEGPLSIDRRRTGTNKWVVWSSDNDVQVMDTRFWTMVELLNKDSSQYDAVRLFKSKTGEVLSSALCGDAAKELVAGILPPET